MADTQFTFKITGPEGFKLDFKVPIGITKIGRQPGNDIVLSHAQVSRGHARVETTGAECDLTDLGSSNGTQVNGEKLAANAVVQLKDGDSVKIGPFIIAVTAVVQQVHQTREMARPVIDPSIVSEVEPPPEETPPQEEVQVKEVKEKAATQKKAPAKRPAARKSAEEKPAAAVPPPPPTPPPTAPAYTNGHIPGPPGLTRHSRKLLSYLPGIYHTDFMSRFLGIFEATSLPIEWTIDNFDLFLSAGTAPDDFLPWLASWFDITFDSTWTEEQRRTLLNEAHEIYARRGTVWALRRVLEIYTGVSPEIDDQDRKLDPFTFSVSIPLRKQDLEQGLVEALIEAHKPAHTNYTLTFKR